MALNAMPWLEQNRPGSSSTSTPKVPQKAPVAALGSRMAMLVSSDKQAGEQTNTAAFDLKQDFKTQLKVPRPVRPRLMSTVCHCDSGLRFLNEVLPAEHTPYESHPLWGPSPIILVGPVAASAVDKVAGFLTKR
eukprot:gene8198-7542_t